MWRSAFTYHLDGRDVTAHYPSFHLSLGHAWYQLMFRQHGPGFWTATKVQLWTNCFPPR